MNAQLSPERKSEILHENMEESDCAVVALQAVTGWSRAKALKRLGARYVPGIGVGRGAIEIALNGSGINTKSLWPERETAATFALTHERGRYLVYVEAHVMALVDGDLFNSRGQWRAPVEAVTEIVG